MAKLIGIGVGPGDPEYVTLKALRCMRESDVLILPDADVGKSTAYNIALGADPTLADKQTCTVVMPMTHDKAVLRANYRKAADLVEEFLRDGKTVGMLTLGDPTVYSTYMYVHQLVTEDGYETEIISGVPSFCAAAARLGISLAERSDALHIIPSVHGIEASLQLKGNKVLMKAASKMGEVREQLIASGMDVKMVENCGMETEKIYRSAEEIDPNAGYFSLIIAKDRKDG